MKNIIKLTLLISVISLAGCQAGYGTKKIAYLSVDMPSGPIYTNKNSHRNAESITRTSPGVYRPPADVSYLITKGSFDTTKVYRDINVVMQTPICYFPIVCLGEDRVITY